LILSAQPLSKAINVSSQNFSDFLSPPRCPFSNSFLRCLSL
jgi:hypothetical protein